MKDPNVVPVTPDNLMRRDQYLRILIAVPAFVAKSAMTAAKRPSVFNRFGHDDFRQH